MAADFGTTFGAFLLESLQLFGRWELASAVMAFVIVVTGVAWASARLLDKEEPHFGAALSSSLMLVLLGGFLAVAYFAFQLKALCASGSAPGSSAFFFCAAVCGFLLLVMVHGAFGTAWWRTPVMALVLVLGSVPAGWLAHHVILGGRSTQLILLAEQTAGLKTEMPSIISTERLRQIAAAHGMQVQRRELTRRQDALVKTYLSLQEERGRLNVADAAAVTTFNQLAASYAAEKSELQRRQAELDAQAKPSPVVAPKPGG